MTTVSSELSAQTAAIQSALAQSQQLQQGQLSLALIASATITPPSENSVAPISDRIGQTISTSA